MFLLIDNYDSFTYNLAQAFQTLGKSPLVLKNDDPEILSLAQSGKMDMVCISPGPGRPENAGLCPRFLELLDPSVPVLGICLGHELLGLYGGATIGIAPQIMHGKDSRIIHDNSGMFKNLPNQLIVGRYHSLIVQETDISRKHFTVTARGPHGEVMGLQYNDRPWAGAQFHPESVLTPQGIEYLANFPDRLLPEKEPLPFAQMLSHIAAGHDLDEETAAQAFAELMDGKFSNSQAAAFLLGLHMKGESALELHHAVMAALNRAIRIDAIPGKCIDVVGTGGDGKHCFNCSTATSLVLAGMGYKVAKHGNRAVSSACGAADVLEGLGFRLPGTQTEAIEQLESCNFTFFFAPYYHPAFKNIGPIRRELGVPTLFNLLGPMINPAKPSHLLMGVAREELVNKIITTLSKRNFTCAAAVHGAGGYDEVTPLGVTEVPIMRNGSIATLTIDPARYGIKKCSVEDLACHDKEKAVETMQEILSGQGPQPMADMVTLNTALALHMLEDNLDFDTAMENARKAVESGVGAKVLSHAG